MVVVVVFTFGLSSCSNAHIYANRNVLYLGTCVLSSFIVHSPQHTCTARAAAMVSSYNKTYLVYNMTPPPTPNDKG